MQQSRRKPMLTPSKPLTEAASEGQGEHRTPKPLVGGSIPSGPASQTAHSAYT
jgi:hypothetical protein